MHVSSQGHQGSQTVSSADLRQEGSHPHLHQPGKVNVISGVLSEVVIYNPKPALFHMKPVEFTSVSEVISGF